MSKSIPFHPEEYQRTLTSSFVFNLKSLNPHLDGDGNLTVELPCATGLILTEETRDLLLKHLGDRGHDNVVDEVARVVNGALVVETLKARMR